MNDQTEAVAVRNRAPVAIGSRGVIIESIEALFRIADGAFSGGFAPSTYKTREAVAIGMQMGMELGLPPLAALQNIAVINGRPTLWGDAQLGVCRATGELEDFAEWYENKTGPLARNPENFTDDIVAVCRVKRRGFEPQEVSFSVGDAKRAGLWGKAGPWTQYPGRMLRYRARGFALRDNFGDALRGLMSAEEAGDIIDITPKETTPRRVSSPPSIPDPTQATQPTAEAKPEPTAPVTNDRFAELESLIAGVGATFDDFVFVMNSNSVWKPWVDGIASVADMKGEHVDRVLSRRAFLTKMLASVVAERKGGAV